MPKHEVKIIVNPNADLGRAWRWASELHPIVKQYGGADWSGTVYPTHALELARQAGEAGYKLVIAVGGDGTVHEVINGLMRLPPDQRPKLGIVPFGSGNDFAYAAGVEHRSAKALKQVFTGKPKRMDVARLEDDRGLVEYVDNTVGIGFDATVNIRSRKITMVRGFFVYFIAVLQTILLNHEAPRMRVKTDREQWDEEMLMLVLCNGRREGGGFIVAPEARPDDGLFDYAAIRRVSRAMMLRLVPEVMRGTHGRFKQVSLGKLSRLELETDRAITIHTDGEIFAGFGTNVHRISLQVLPGEIEVVV
jgi:diacylglycerol kinase (ATP)